MRVSSQFNRLLHSWSLFITSQIQKEHRTCFVEAEQVYRTRQTQSSVVFSDVSQPWIGFAQESNLTQKTNLQQGNLENNLHYQYFILLTWWIIRFFSSIYTFTNMQLNHWNTLGCTYGDIAWRIMTSSHAPVSQSQQRILDFIYYTFYFLLFYQCSISVNQFGKKTKRRNFSWNFPNDLFLNLNKQSLNEMWKK